MGQRGRYASNPTATNIISIYSPTYGILDTMVTDVVGAIHSQLNYKFVGPFLPSTTPEFTAQFLIFL